MASSKVMSSSASRNSDLRRRSSSSASSKPFPISEPHQHHHHINHHQQANSDGRSEASVPMTADGDNQAVAEGMLLDAEITLLDAAGAVTAISDNEVNRGLKGTPSIRRQESGVPASSARKTLDEVWREMVDGRIQRKECKQEAPDEMMTLEDFLAKADAVEDNVKVEPLALSTERVSGGIFSYDSMPLSRYSSQHSVDSMMGFGSGGEGMGGRGKKRAVLEPLDKAAQQRQRRMIKNRESAARSRERKQAYQAELEYLAAKLEEENEKLLKEKAERTQKRLKQIMEKVIPVVERRKPKRPLRRVQSMHW